MHLTKSNFRLDQAENLAFEFHGNSREGSGLLETAGEQLVSRCLE
jgi:hypothetical protein